MEKFSRGVYIHTQCQGTARDPPMVKPARNGNGQSMDMEAGRPVEVALSLLDLRRAILG